MSYVNSCVGSRIVLSFVLVNNQCANQQQTCISMVTDYLIAKNSNFNRKTWMIHTLDLLAKTGILVIVVDCLIKYLKLKKYSMLNLDLSIRHS